MAENSRIEWTMHTMNPWRGCSKLSAGCQFCYADTLSKRNPGTLGIWGPKGTRVVAAEAHWKLPLKWNQWAKDGVCYACGGKGGKAIGERCEICDGTGNIGPHRPRVFSASLADVFEKPDTMPEESRPVVAAARARLFDLIRQCPNLDFLLLTKRPDNIIPAIEDVWGSEVKRNYGKPFGDLENWLYAWLDGNPPVNVWLGTSIENQDVVWRADALCEVPAVCRFLSVEPLLGPIKVDLYGIHWVIVGGESGPNARPLHPDWARSIRDQCAAAGVPYFFKQWGEFAPDFRDPEMIPVPERTRMIAMRHDGTHFQGMWNRAHCPRDVAIMERVGKKAADRVLDGVLHNEFPKVGAA